MCSAHVKWITFYKQLGVREFTSITSHCEYEWEEAQISHSANENFQEFYFPILIFIAWGIQVLK